MNTRSRNPASSGRTALAGLAAAVLLVSCGNKNSPSGAASSDRDQPTTRQAPDPPADSPRSVYESAAVDLQSLFDKLSSTPPAAAGPAPTPTPAPQVRQPDPAPTVSLDSPAAPPAKPEPTKHERRLEYARQLAKLLVPDGDDTRSPIRAVLPLIALETIQPGVATAELNRLLATLSESERSTVDTVRSLMAQLEAQADTGADPQALAAAVRSEVDRAQPKPPPAPMLALGTVALCRKVEAFGRFTSYPGSSFVAGRLVPMIVYTEVENYVQARESELPSAGNARKPTGDRWALELSQEIHLYSSDGTLCWFVKEQTHRDASQSKRRDFFLVQRIDLPASLSIGRYTLKVIVRDKAAAAIAGDGEPLAEANIPISIVADNAVAAADSTRPVISGRGPATAAAGDDR